MAQRRSVAQAGTLQARSTAVDTEAWNARPTQRHRALREGAALGRIETMVDESIVQKLCRIRVYANEDVEGKRNEGKVVLVIDCLASLEVVVVE